MTSNLWMFNDGSYAHRGVWHAIDEVYDEKSYDAVRKEEQRDLWGYHQQGCDLYYRSYGDPIYEHRSGWYMPERDKPVRTAVCTCALDTKERHVVIGHYTQIDIIPAYKTAKGDAICGQKDEMLTGGLEYGTRAKGKREDGGTVTEAHKAKAYNVVDQVEEPIGPTCSRCVTKREKQNGA